MMMTSYSARGSGEVHCLSQPLCPLRASRATAKTEYLRIRLDLLAGKIPCRRPYKSQIQMRHNVSFATPGGFCFDTVKDCAGCGGSEAATFPPAARNGLHEIAG